MYLSLVYLTSFECR